MTRTLTSTPRQDGFRMPGEFEPHVGCWMLWPERSDNWRSGAKPAQGAFAAVAAAIAEAEPVHAGFLGAERYGLGSPRARAVASPCARSFPGAAPAAS